MDSPRHCGQIPRPLAPGAAVLTTDTLVLILAALLPVLVGAWRRAPHGHGQVGGAAALLGGALASLGAGTGGLELDAWRGYATTVPGGQAFIAAGVGAALAAAWSAPGGLAWRLAAAPFTALVLREVGALLRSPALAAGAAVVVALLAFGAGLGRSRQPVGPVAPAPWPVMDRALLVGVVALLLWGAPIAIALLAVLAVVWRTHAARRTTGWWGIPMVLTLLLGALGWLLLTVAETPWALLRSAATEVPLSAAAERIVGNLWVAAVALLAGAWPLARQGLSLRTAPAGIALAFVGATMVSPDGLAAWRPLATLVLVPAALVAAARRDRAGMAGAVAGLVALQGTVLALAAALLVLAWPLASLWRGGNPGRPDRVTLHEARIGGGTLALGFALAPLVILPDEVLLGTLLAAGFGLLLPAWGGAPEPR